MKRLEADLLIELQTIARHIPRLAGVSTRHLQQEYRFSKTELSGLKKGIRRYKKYFEYLGLTHSERLASELYTDLKVGIPHKQVEFFFKELGRMVRRELESVIFGFITNNRAAFFNASSLMGNEVYRAFPSARPEVIEAGNCYAHGLNTACVFHLMRAVEIGAKVLVRAMKAERFITRITSVSGVKKEVKRPIELCDWGALVGGLETALRGFESGSPMSLSKKETLIYYSHAVVAFRNFKDAWRNNVSHGRITYSETDTEIILQNTRQFLEHLAKRLAEPEPRIVREKSKSSSTKHRDTGKPAASKIHAHLKVETNITASLTPIKPYQLGIRLIGPKERLVDNDVYRSFYVEVENPRPQEALGFELSILETKAEFATYPFPAYGPSATPAVGLNPDLDFSQPTIKREIVTQSLSDKAKVFFDIPIVSGGTPTLEKKGLWITLMVGNSSSDNPMNNRLGFWLYADREGLLQIHNVAMLSTGW